MRKSNVEGFEILISQAQNMGITYQTCPLTVLPRAEIRKQITAFLLFAVPLPSQMTYINASLLFRRPFHIPEMTIVKSFFNSEDETDRRSDQMHEKLFYSQIQEFSKCCARFALWPKPEVYQLLRGPSISRISRQIASRVRTFLQSSSVISNIEIQKS
jgi:hypothetical protein